ncbi:TPA: hypothetical protein ACOQ40_005572 [Bacillus cereus]
MAKKIKKAKKSDTDIKVKKPKKFETELIDVTKTCKFSKVIRDKRYDNIKLKYVLFPKKELTLQEFFEIIIGDRFEKKDYIMEIYRDYHQVKHCKDMKEVMYYAKWASHFVPNTFYKWADRSLENLRCSQWMVFDFELKKSDGKAFLPAEVYQIFLDTVGFEPTIIKQSKSYGHYHVMLKHTTINGKPESSYLFQRIQKMIAERVGTDLGAIGANHNFSIPNNGERIFYFGDNTIPFDDLKNWWYAEISKENKSKKYSNNGKVTSLTEHLVWNHQAIKALKEYDFDGSRNQAGFTLALLYFALGKSKQECERFLVDEWYIGVPQRGKKYRLSELKASIRSAYSEKYAGPSKEKIEALTGIEFNIRVIRSHYKKEIRHNQNENVQAVINYFRERGGKIEGMTKKALIEDICKTQESPMGKPFAERSIKRHLDNLKKEGRVLWESTGSGGNTKDKTTVFTLKDGIQESSETIVETIIEEDHNVYAFGKVVN